MPELVTKSEFGRRMGITPSAVTRALKSKRIAEATGGLLDFEACVASYRERTDPERQRRSLHQRAALRYRKSPSEELDELRLRRERADTARAERRAKVEAGEYLPVAEVEAAIARAVGLTNERLVLVPLRLTGELTLQQTQLVESEIRAALASLVIDFRRSSDA